MRRRAPLALLFALYAAPARAFVLSEDELADTSTEAGVVVRSYGFVLAGKTLAPPFAPEDANPSAVNVEDLRTYVSYRSTHLRLVWHQESTSIVRSAASLGALPMGLGPTPPRFLPLDASFSGSNLRLATQADWAYAAYAAGAVTLTLGRQPVTFGRGRLFHPWDVVSSFALTQVDTEYKPGVDAARIAVSPSSETTIDLVAAVGALGENPDFHADASGSSFVATLKQGWAHGEFSGLAGLVRNDVVLGYGALWTFRSFDLYAEATATWLRGHSLSSPAVQGRSAAVPRALAGISIKPSDSLTVIPEIYYDGFGARSPAGYLGVLTSERVAIGEQITLGRLYTGAAVDWEADPLVHVTALAMSDVLDPSALVSVALSYDASANTRLLAGAYAPVGAPPHAASVPEARSEFGLYPDFAFVQVRVVL